MADDPSLPIAVRLGRVPASRWGLGKMDTTLLRRDKREDQTCGCAVRATCTYTCTHTNNSPNFTSPAIARRRLCYAVPCYAVLCCVVMWLHPLSALLVHLSTGAGILAADPVSHVTQHLFLPCPLFSLPLCLALSACLPVCLTPRRSSVKVRVLLPADELIQQWQPSEKRPANRDPQYPSCLPASWPCLMRP